MPAPQSQRSLKIALIALTYDKTAHATGLWRVCSSLQATTHLSFTTFHVYNGQSTWYPEKTGEDVLIRRQNLGHIHGVIDMMNAGVEAALQSGETFDFLILCSSDAWFTDGGQLTKCLRNLQTKEQHLLTSRWFGPRTWSSEWFALTPQLAQASFPLSHKLSLWRQFLAHGGNILHAALPIFQAPLVEHILTESLQHGLVKIRAKNAVALLPHREFVWLHNRYATPELGYTSHHEWEKKLAHLPPSLRVHLS